MNFSYVHQTMRGARKIGDIGMVKNVCTYIIDMAIA